MGVTYKDDMKLLYEDWVDDIFDEIEASEQSVSKSRYPLPYHVGNQNENDNPRNLQNANVRSSAQHIIPRLIKLSLLCALCWIVRGAYLMALRIWPSTDRTPFEIPELPWEAIFYCLTEYPPSLGALVLMISRPSRGRGGAHLSMHEYDNYGHTQSLNH